MQELTCKDIVIPDPHHRLRSARIDEHFCTNRGNFVSEDLTPKSMNSADRDGRLYSILERRSDRRAGDRRAQGISYRGDVGECKVRLNISKRPGHQGDQLRNREAVWRRKIYWKPYESLTIKVKAWIRTHELRHLHTVVIFCESVNIHCQGPKIGRKTATKNVKAGVDLDGVRSFGPSLNVVE